MKSDIDWNLINWTLVQQRVSRIQERIFKWSRRNEKNKVIFLQSTLINSLDAKLLSVRHVTTDVSGKRTPGLDQMTYQTPKQKMYLVRHLKVDAKAAPIRRVYIPKPGKAEKRPLGIPTLRDRAKQKLVLLALEPEWEAKFEPNSYGFRPGRSTHDVLEAIFVNTRNSKGSLEYKPKYVLDADLRKCFDQIDHEYLINKLDTSPLIEQQVRAWLKAGIFEGLSLEPELYHDIPQNQLGTPQGDVISPFLANVALHGMEYHLKDWIKSQTWPEAVERRYYSQQKTKSISLIRYADDFVIIHSNESIIQKAKSELSNWLSTTSKLRFNEEKSAIINCAQGFDFLGFSFVYVKRNNKPRMKIYPSKKNQKAFIDNIGSICRKYRSISSYSLINILRPKVVGWANYYRVSECREVFRSIDNEIFSILRSWVFRRDRRHGRRHIKEKYFPSGNKYIFNQKTHKDNWILCGQEYIKSGQLDRNFLPRMTWVNSIKHVKVRNVSSVYDSDELYWVQRYSRKSIKNTSKRKLFLKQNGLCPLCKDRIRFDTPVEIDHIIPSKKGGENAYKNLQIVHRHCHVRKTKIENL